MEDTELDKRFAAIRRDPEGWFKTQTPARQARIKRQVAERELRRRIMEDAQNESLH